MPNYGICRSCGAAIEWCRTENGKNVPLDADPFDDGNVVKIGRGLVRCLDKDESYSGDRFVSHFATCDFAHLHRKPRKLK